MPNDPRNVLGGRDLRGWRQVRCGGCGLPERACLCSTLPTFDVRTRVVIVMHAIEAVRSTNTGRLVAHMLRGAQVVLRGVRDAPVHEVSAGRRLVLFPSEGARALCAEDAVDGLILVVPDGTWAQARRVHRRDPHAQGAEVVSLPLASASTYGLRRASREGGLCTLEAVAAAMGVLESRAVEAAMLAAFATWCERAASVRSGR